MMVVDIREEEKLILGQPRVLFEKHSRWQQYDVSPDGQRFILVDSSKTQLPPSKLVFVLNWTEELKRLVPTN